jgi:hypothetical protein
MAGYFDFSKDPDEKICKIYVNSGIRGDYTIRAIIKEELKKRGIKPKSVVIVAKFEKTTPSVITEIKTESDFILK